METFVPFSALMPGLHDGRILRHGNILRDARRGRILGYLQQTPMKAQGSAEARFSQALGLLGLSASSVSVTGVGIPLSPAEHLQREVEQLRLLTEAIPQATRARFEALPWQALNRRFQEMVEQLAEMERLQRRQGLVWEWLELLARMMEKARFLGDALDTLLADEGFDQYLFRLLLLAQQRQEGACLQVAVWAGDLQLGLELAEGMAAGALRRLDELSPSDLAARIRPPLSDEVRRQALHRALGRLVREARDIQEMVLTRPLIFLALRRQGLDGRRFVRALQEQADTPLVVVGADEEADRWLANHSVAAA